MEQQSSEKESSSSHEKETWSSSQLSVADIQAIHADINDPDDKGKERDVKKPKRGSTIPLQLGLVTNDASVSQSELNVIVADLSKRNRDWPINPDQMFQDLIDDPQKYLPDDLRTALQKALADVKVLTKRENSPPILGFHLVQEFGVFMYAYLPFAIGLVTAWACYNYGGMPEPEARVLAGFIGGFGDFLNSKLFHDLFRWNDSIPTSWSRQKVDEQVQLLRDTIANAIAKRLGVKPDLKTEAKAYPLGAWAFIGNAVVAYLSDGLPMMFFALNLMTGQPLSMDWVTLLTQLLIGTLLSGTGITVIMALRMLAEYCANQPRVQLVDAHGAHDALVVRVQDAIDHLETERIQLNAYGQDTTGIELVIKQYRKMLEEAKENQETRPPAKASTIAKRWNLFVKDGPLTFTQIAGHTFGFMLWPVLAYRHASPVAAGLVGCALGIGARQEWGYALQILGAPVQGLVRGLLQCCRNAEEEEEAAKPGSSKNHDEVVQLPPLANSSSHS